MRFRPLVALSATALLLAACGGDDSSAGDAAADGDRLQVVTTVAPITSIAANIIGDKADITGIVPEGTNSHTFEPRPSDAEILAKADVIFINGLVLEEPTKELAEQNKQSSTRIIELGAETIGPDQYLYDFSFPKEEGKPNPHLWTNPLMVKTYAEVIAGTMGELDPANADYYSANLAKYVAELDELDAAMRTAFETVPVDQRELLTYHDAYAYFAKDYDWRVVGAIQVSDFEDPTPKEVADLIAQVRAEEVPAIFGSEVFPSPVLEQIAKETGAEYYDDLRDDDLPGTPGEEQHSLLRLLQFNYATITKALGGDPSAIEAATLDKVAPDTATYPQ